MQSAQTRLSILKQKSEHDEYYEFKRLFRNLYNPDFYLRAYQKLSQKEGNHTPGIDNATIDGFSLQTVQNLIELQKTGKYKPKPSKRVYIPKKNGKLRPLGIPCFEDKVIHEIVREILEAIYEPIFCDSSHGFRPNRSCQTALHQIKNKAAGTNWVIEVDITRFFENIDHNTLMKLLAKKIKDGRILDLIRCFLKAGYFDLKEVHNSLSGTPQGSGLSPILANIYLHTLDQHVEELARQYSKGVSKQLNPPYSRLLGSRRRALKRGDKKKAKQFLKQMRAIPSRDPMDESFIRVNYVRFADDMLVCIIGSRALAVEIKEKLTVFMGQTLRLELNQEKTAITNLAKRRVRFLGYELSKTQCNTKITKNRAGRKARSVNGRIVLLVPGQVIRDKLKPFKKGIKPYPYKARNNLAVKEIIEAYNAEIRGLYDYYCLAADVSRKLGTFKHFHYGSLLKTLAGKMRLSVRATICSYGVLVPRKQRPGSRRIIGVQYDTAAGRRILTYFDKSLSRVEFPLVGVRDWVGPFLAGKQLMARFKKSKCELCGSLEGIVVHHVRKLKMLKHKYGLGDGGVVPVWVTAMLKSRRKALVVCRRCHAQIHAFGEVQ